MRPPLFLSRRGVSEAQIVAGDTEIDAHVAAVAQAVIDGSMLPYYQSFDGRTASSILGPAVMSAGAGFYLTPIDGPARTIAILSKFRYFLGAANSANVGMGLYLRTNATDFTLVGGSLIAAASGANALQDLAPTVAINRAASPMLCLCIGLSNGTVTVSRMGALQAMAGSGMQAFFKGDAVPAIGQPMPSTITGAASTTNVPWIYAE